MCVYTHTYIYAHTHNGVLLSHKKDEILSLATTGMCLEGNMLSEVCQREMDKKPYEFTHIWNIKQKRKNEQKK